MRKRLFLHLWFGQQSIVGDDVFEQFSYQAYFVKKSRINSSVLIVCTKGCPRLYFCRFTKQAWYYWCHSCDTNLVAVPRLTNTLSPKYPKWFRLCHRTEYFPEQLSVPWKYDRMPPIKLSIGCVTHLTALVQSTQNLAYVHYHGLLKNAFV